nr:MAG TPA: hypothetical protein [Caudoviricetes sp.]
METLPKSASEDRRVRGLSNPSLSFLLYRCKGNILFWKIQIFFEI